MPSALVASTGTASCNGDYALRALRKATQLHSAKRAISTVCLGARGSAPTAQPSSCAGTCVTAPVGGGWGQMPPLAASQEQATPAMQKTLHCRDHRGGAGSTNVAGGSYSQSEFPAMHSSQPCSQPLLMSQPPLEVTLPALDAPASQKQQFGGEPLASLSTQTPSNLGPSSNAEPSQLASQFFSQPQWPTPQQCLSQPIWPSQPQPSSQSALQQGHLPQFEHSQLPSQCFSQPQWTTTQQCLSQPIWPSQPQPLSQGALQHGHPQQPTAVTNRGGPVIVANSVKPRMAAAVAAHAAPTHVPAFALNVCAQPASIDCTPCVAKEIVPNDVAAAATTLLAALAGSKPPIPKSMRSVVVPGEVKELHPVPTKRRRLRGKNPKSSFSPASTASPSSASCPKKLWSPGLDDVTATFAPASPTLDTNGLFVLNRTASEAKSNVLADLDQNLQTAREEYTARLNSVRNSARLVLTIASEYKKACMDSDVALDSVLLAVKAALTASGSIFLGQKVHMQQTIAHESKTRPLSPNVFRSAPLLTSAQALEQKSDSYHQRGLVSLNGGTPVVFAAARRRRHIDGVTAVDKRFHAIA